MNSKALFLFIRGIGFFFREFRYNIISALSIATLLFIYFAIYTSGTGVSEFLSKVAEISSIRAYLMPNVKNSDEIKTEIEKIQGISGVTYFSQKDAKEFVINNTPSVANLKSFSDDFFPAFFEIKPSGAYSKQEYEKIGQSLMEIKGIESVSHGDKYISKFINVNNGFIVFLFIISCLFVLTISFQIFSSVRLAMFRYQEELKIYVLVGATRPFVYLPYLACSMITSVLAYVLAVVVFSILFAIFNSGVLIPAGIILFELPNFSFFALMLLMTMFVCFVASMVSIFAFYKRVSTVNEN